MNHHNPPSPNNVLDADWAPTPFADEELEQRLEVIQRDKNLRHAESYIQRLRIKRALGVLARSAAFFLFCLALSLVIGWAT